MPYIELAAALYLGAQAPFITADGLVNVLLFKVPVYLFGMALFFDSVTRLGWGIAG